MVDVSWSCQFLGGILLGRISSINLSGEKDGGFLKHSVLGRNLRRSWTVNEDDLLSKTYFDLNKAWSDVMIFFCDFVHVITGLFFVTKESYINS